MLTEYHRLCVYFTLLPLLLLSCTLDNPAPIWQADTGAVPAETVITLSDTPIPLVDMLNNETYLGFHGGLYPSSSNEIPAQHHLEGLISAGRVQPLDTSGNPDPHGKYVLLSIGMSNASQEFCHAGPEPPRGCYEYSFMGKAAQDSSINHAHLSLVNGAYPGALTNMWTSLDDEYGHYERIAYLLSKEGLTPHQVQVVWIKLANGSPQISLPDQNADAYVFMADLAEIARTLKVLYPNLQQAYISSRIYGGYANPDHSINPEPYAYEYGYSIKWLVQAQIDQMESGQINPITGSLDYQSGLVPWLAWGAYLWADGMNPRQLDNLVWELDDYAGDLTHPSPAGREKVADLLMDFFKNSPHTCAWFLENGSCQEPDDPIMRPYRINFPILIFSNFPIAMR